MIARKQGDIVNIASTSGMKGGKAGTPTRPASGPCAGSTQCWQTELRPQGIRVVCVCPSEVQTNWGGRTGRNNPNKLYAEDIGGTILAALDMPRRVLWPESPCLRTTPGKKDSCRGNGGYG